MQHFQGLKKSAFCCEKLEVKKKKQLKKLPLEFLYRAKIKL